MKISRGFRRLQFSIWTLFIVTTLLGIYLGAAPRIQDAREAWRRSRLHLELGPKVYGYHGAYCQPCRRQMAYAICDETESLNARVAWINELVGHAKRDGHVRDSLKRASSSPSAAVRTAAHKALLESGLQR